MKKNEVPQDKSDLITKNMTDMLYALDEKGNYTTALSTGWDTKTIALDEAMDLVKDRIDDARARVKLGKTSPVEYFMELNRMELFVLASYVRMPQWRVKRHFKPEVFKKLSDKILQRYAETFNISVPELKDYKG